MAIALATAHRTAHPALRTALHGRSAHLVICKLVSVDRLGLTIRAEPNLIARDRRRSTIRLPINLGATLVSG